jgi:hypothetical protein
MNSGNTLNKVLPFCRVKVLPLNYLTATPHYLNTSALEKTATLQHLILLLTPNDLLLTKGKLNEPK